MSIANLNDHYCRAPSSLVDIVTTSDQKAIRIREQEPSAMRDVS